MFYSQTYLARKGPLGTVWCAAHLQHRLKKSHYTATNIPETVDLIICPEVPMALRMSSHLLLGVVRIYSKKVDYLFRDYTLLHTWLAKAFVSTQVDLPEDARQAPVESVTLPQALNLDDFNLEEDDSLDREFDNHLRSQEDITLTDQIPTGIDPYIAVTFDEDIIPESSPMDIDQSTVPVSERPGETDVEMAYEPHDRGESSAGLGTGTFIPRDDTEELPEFREPGPINFTEPLNLSPERNNGDSPGSVPEIEIRRDAAQDRSPVSHPSFAAPLPSVSVEQTESLNETLNEKEPSIPGVEEEVLNSRGPSTFELRSGSPGAAGSEEERGNFVHPSPEMVLQPSPSPPPQPQPQARPRKRKHFDRATVLTNAIMQQRLNDPSDTLRKRKKMPSSKVGVWRLNNNKNDQIFNEPLLTGFSDGLRSVFEKDCVSSKPYLAVSDETLQEPASVSSPTREAATSPEPASVSSPPREAETEINRSSPIPQSPVPEFTNPQRSPSQQMETVQDVTGPQSVNAESVAAEAQSPQTYNNDDMGIEHLREGGYPEYMSSPAPRSSPFRTGDFTAQTGTWETGSYRTESSTTSTIPEDMSGSRNSGLSAIPEMADEDLYFLEVGGNTPVRSPASQDSDALTGRTRALAKYLQERSSSSPSSSSGSGDLSLSKLLAGKTRKIAARMFYETLVLKSRGLIDMHQDEPYSDIALKLMPNLFSKV